MTSNRIIKISDERNLRYNRVQNSNFKDEENEIQRLINWTEDTVISGQNARILEQATTGNPSLCI